MKERIIEKNKYFIYNEDNKILVFYSISDNGFIHISIPSEILAGYRDSTGRFYDNIRNLLIKKDKICFLDKTMKEDIVYISENNKLKKQILQTIRNYYSCYKEFSKSDCEIIMKLCYECKVWPEFFSIDELIRLIEKKDHKDFYDIEEGMRIPLEELDKRMSFIKY